MKKVQETNDKEDSSSSSSFVTSPLSENSNERDSHGKEIDGGNNDLSPPSDTEEESPASSSRASPAHKLNIRARRNKMSFSKERQKTKHRHLPNDLSNDNEDSIEGNDLKVTIIPATKKGHHHHHRHRPKLDDGKLSKLAEVNSKAILLSDENLVDQLRTLIKSRGRHRDFLLTLSKETGLSKTKVHQLIHNKDLRVLTLQTLLSLLNSYHSTLLIVPK